ncbi:chromosome partitioning ATPase [Tersicoccus solisilvae]|uniref:Chromosome partitioning ATPase n=1 Tax=Tersicoccus solisilvae TaxID=1882339 RepID=A0ABQ1PCT5_9MICC|nr:ParA family protein [Tersicoccus solisilvae]GGC94722.1 chromosome partitioning ATPase [Tersicoccus solisilvae]
MHVVSITSLKGGVGKTTVTLGLASAALHAGLRVLVVDLDPHADATTALAVRRGRGVDAGHLLRNARRQRLADAIAPSAWSRVERTRVPGTAGRLDVVPGSAYSGIFDRPDLGRRDLTRLHRLLTRDDETTAAHDLVLIDCPPSLNGLTRIAWTASSGVLLVAEPALFSVAGTERTLRALDLFRHEYAPGLRTAGIVANRVRQDSPEQVFRLREMERMFASLLLRPALVDRPVLQQIQGAAHAVHHWPGADAVAAARDFDAVLAGLGHLVEDTGPAPALQPTA